MPSDKFQFQFQFQVSFFFPIYLSSNRLKALSQNFIHLFRLRSRNRIYALFLRTQELLSDKYLL